MKYAPVSSRRSFLKNLAAAPLAAKALPAIAAAVSTPAICSRPAIPYLLHSYVEGEQALMADLSRRMNEDIRRNLARNNPYMSFLPGSAFPDVCKI